MVKHLPATQSLGWEDPLERGVATHSSILAWRIPWTEKPGRLESMEKSTDRRAWRLESKEKSTDRRAWRLESLGLQGQTGLSD